MFLTVYLTNNEQHFTEVPVTSETTCKDVVDLCKEPGETECHLAEVWCGSGMYIMILLLTCMAMYRIVSIMKSSLIKYS